MLDVFKSKQGDVFVRPYGPFKTYKALLSKSPIPYVIPSSRLTVNLNYTYINELSELDLNLDMDNIPKSILSCFYHFISWNSYVNKSRSVSIISTGKDLTVFGRDFTPVIRVEPVGDNFKIDIGGMSFLPPTLRRLILWYLYTMPIGTSIVSGCSVFPGYVPPPLLPAVTEEQVSLNALLKELQLT